MVCCEDVDTAFGNRTTDSRAVRRLFDRRVTFDKMPLALVVAVIKPEMVYTGLGGYALSLKGARIEEGDFLGSSDVQDVKTGIRPAGKIHR